jgi:hypothetical protein
VGVAPFAALLLLLAHGRRLSAREQAFAAGAAAISAWLLVQVAAFATLPFVLRIEERNAFYLAPLFFAALAFWLERGVPRRSLVAPLAAAAAVVLPAFVPYPRLINISATSDTLALLSLWRLAEVGSFPLERVWIAVVLGGAVLAGLFLILPRRALVALPLLLLALYGLAAQPIDARIRAASMGALFQGITEPQRDWLDRAVGRDADVAALWTGLTDPLTVFENELFSRSVRDAYYLRDPLPGGLPQRAVSVDEGDGVIRGADGAPISASYLLADDSLPLEGRIVVRDERKGLRVFRLDGPARVSGLTRGIYGDLWSEPSFSYRGFRCGGGVLRARLGSDSRLFARPQRVVAHVNGRPALRARVRPEVEETIVSVPLRPGRGGVCAVRFRVLDTAIPASRQPGSDDTREVGVRVLGLDRP